MPSDESGPSRPTPRALPRFCHSPLATRWRPRGTGRGRPCRARPLAAQTGRLWPLATPPRLSETTAARWVRRVRPTHVAAATPPVERARGGGRREAAARALHHRRQCIPSPPPRPTTTTRWIGSPATRLSLSCPPYWGAPWPRPTSSICPWEKKWALSG